ncbi:hypothetical protein I302_106455 [Kwoniella bestiolae CBS 10118]|uniref:Uncharacterized protein n=1 Tax=Kwoniella bestiolae CBS 10118 TaxID=1296100 RepID=A0A1B9G1C8_9TREE|nr:hypothetical protein I302_06288 [Kwoniella bestiolae CBS 10118]OCF24827.1 hypothetical protein I302_06288 [Kwoniella bestiolae CBS 10118]
MNPYYQGPPADEYNDSCDSQQRAELLRYQGECGTGLNDSSYSAFSNVQDDPSGVLPTIDPTQLALSRNSQPIQPTYRSVHPDWNQMSNTSGKRTLSDTLSQFEVSSDVRMAKRQQSSGMDKASSPIDLAPSKHAYEFNEINDKYEERLRRTVGSSGDPSDTQQRSNLDDTAKGGASGSDVTGQVQDGAETEDERQLRLLNTRWDAFKVDEVPDYLKKYAWGKPIPTRWDQTLGKEVHYPWLNLCPGSRHRIKPLEGIMEPRDNPFAKATGLQWLATRCAEDASCKAALTDEMPCAMPGIRRAASEKNKRLDKRKCARGKKSTSEPAPSYGLKSATEISQRSRPTYE